MPVPVIAERNAGQDRLNLRTPEPFSVGNAGAVGDGLADDYNALFEAAKKQGTSGAIFLPPGTYAVGTSLTIACQVFFAFGAKLKPDTGVTVTLAGPVTTAPGDGIIAIGTGGTVNVTGPLNAGGVLDVRTFGAKGDGVTDDTAAIRRAFQAAGVNGGIVFFPVGEYLQNVFVPANIADAPTLVSGVQAVGAGYNTVIKLNPASVASQPNSNQTAWYYDSNSSVRNMRFDGNRAAVEALVGLATGIDVYLLRPVGQDVENCQFTDLWIHDVFGSDDKESFGIQTEIGCNNFLYENIQCWNISGTGLHAAGWDYDTGNRARDFVFRNIRSTDCKWQGVSIYGASDVTLDGVYTARCGQVLSRGGVGINIEFSENVNVYNSVGTACKYGLRVIGPSTVYIADSDFYANGETFGGFASDNADVTLLPGEWRVNGVPVLNGPPTIVEFGPGTRITPTIHPYHIFVRATIGALNDVAVPRSIVLSSENGPVWTFRVQYIGLVTSQLTTSNNASFCNVTIPSARVVRPIETSRLAAMGQSGTMSIAAYAGTGNIDPNAVTFSSSVDNSQRRTGFILKANRTYLVRTRVKAEDGGLWSLLTRTSGGTGNVGSMILAQSEASVDEWFEGECIIRCDANDYRIQYQFNVTDAVASSSLSVDYLTVLELVGNVGQAQDNVSAISDDRGDADVELIATTDAEVQRFATTLTANRTITLSTILAYRGAKFRIVRTGLGSFTLDVGGLKTIPSATAAFVDVMHDGTAWRLTGYGTL